MSFVNEIIRDDMLVINDIRAVMSKYHFKTSQGLFFRERKCFILQRINGLVREWSNDSLSLWVMFLDGEIIEFSKTVLKYEKVDEFTFRSSQRIVDLKIQKNSRFNKQYILDLIILALKEYKEVGVSYAHKIINYDLSIDLGEI